MTMVAIARLATRTRSIAGSTTRSLRLVKAIKRHLAAVIDLDNLHLHLVAHVEHILNLLHAALGHTGDVQEAIFTRKQVHKGTEGLDGDNATGVLLPHLGLLDDELDALNGLLNRLANAAHEHGAIFLDIHGGTRLILDAANRLAALANDLADLVGGYADGLDTGRRGARSLARTGNDLKHFAQNEGAACLGLLESGLQDIEGEAGGLVVHLKGRDTTLGARHFEVHVAQEVLEALDVGEHHRLALFLDKAHGNARHGALDGHAAVHEGKAARAGGSHRRGAVGLHDLRHHANGVGELHLVGEYRQKRTLGQVAVTNLTTLGAADAAHLAGAVGREVVLVHIALAINRLNSVKALGLVKHAEREHREDLGLTTLEKARAVHQREVGILHHDGANLVSRTAVNALARLNDHGAHGLLLKLLEVDGNLALPLKLLFLGKLSTNLLFERLHLGDAALLISIAKCGSHLVIVCEHALLNLGNRLIKRVLLGHDGAVNALPLLNEGKLGIAEGTDGLLAKLHGSQHVVLGDLVGTGLHHGDKVTRTSKLKVEVGVLALLIGGVDDELARLAVAANAHARQRALKRHATQGERQACTHGADDVDGVHLVGHKRGGNNLHLVAEAVREARTDRTVDHARSERRLLRRTALALEVTTRDAARSIQLLVEINRQREEVVVLTLLGNDDGHERGGVPLLHKDGARCLLGKLAALKHVGLAKELKGSRYECHCSPSSPYAPLRTGTSGSKPHHEARTV